MNPTNTKRILIAKILLWFAAISALGAAASAVPVVADASPDTKAVEAWRMVGFATFAGLFAVLARKPQGNRVLWLIVILNKLLLAILGLVFLTQSDVKGASDIVVFDGTLVTLLVTAFLLTNRLQK